MPNWLPDQHYKRIPENPRRGQIIDRNGVELAGTTYVYRIGITPKDVHSITKNITTAEIAAKIADMPEPGSGRCRSGDGQDRQDVYPAEKRCAAR